MRNRVKAETIKRKKKAFESIVNVSEEEDESSCDVKKWKNIQNNEKQEWKGKKRKLGS
jgi:hypothetical protein